jgi:ferrous iron transport protein B
MKRVLLAGNPNSGKTTLFNALTGARARVGNYPGVTVERRVGKASLPGLDRLEVVDLPGTYSLSAHSAEEQVAMEALLHGEKPDAVIVVVDATALARALYLAVQVIETGAPTLIALNMMDEARAAGVRIDVAGLAARLGVPVVPMVAARSEGTADLAAPLAQLFEAPPLARPFAAEGALAVDVAEVETEVAGSSPELGLAARRARALWALLSLGEDELAGVPQGLRSRVVAVRARAAAAGRDLDLEIISARYARIDEAVAATVQRTPETAPSRTERIDRVLTHRIAGPVVFAAVMAVVFEALFSWSEPFVGAIEGVVAFLQAQAGGALPEGIFRDLVVSGIIAGVGNVVVFVPQIALLFFFIGVLEDTGYLARVAFVIDRLMARVGLHGRAFVPMLSGYACAIPGVMATRTIDSRRDRLLTMLVVPLSSCSARLPVYVLIISVVFAGAGRVGGVMSTGAVVLLALYLSSAIVAIGAAAVLRRTVLRGPRPTMVLELPPYRLPVVRNLLAAVWHKVRAFLVDAGTVILALTIVLWAMLTFPRDEQARAHADAERTRIAALADGEEKTAALAHVDHVEAQANLQHSVGGRLGKVIEPIIAPLGFDWRIGIGILGSFAAREVFVSTMGIVFGVGDDDEEVEPLRQALADAKRDNGAVLMTPLTGVSLMIFFAFAAQCLSTVAVVKRESASWRWPIFMVVYMSVLAFAASLLVFQVGRALGFA